ncbi:hypothetical protein WA026_016074 [Henosepilachna vigintioctopunctata]|uniref:PR domain zinc finger protein 10 n=1 Tax=Henosepilachna vigintioctopunctata TaxID=420089 RepID=A0AAW1U3I5_9CUCU
MEGIEGCNSQSQTVAHNLSRIESDWRQSQNISTNPGNSTLLYIAVEYVKEEYKGEAETGMPSCDNYSTFQQHVSTLDPNMSSVARYSPVYNDPSNSYNTVVIHPLVSSDAAEEDAEFVDNLTTNSSLGTLPTVLCNTDINNINNQYLQMVDNDIVNGDSPTSIQSLSNTNKEQEVEILITDQATGISYSVSTQELLVEEEQLLEGLSANPLLDSELLTIDESTLKNNLPEDLIDTNINASSHSNIVNNFISNFCSDSIKLESMGIDNDYSKLRKRSSPNELECEDKLLSRVYNIIDKPIPTRARATLPEPYLKILKIGEEWGVFAKRSIRKRTQFGPVQGIMKSREEVVVGTNKLELLIVVNEGILGLDISNEDLSNWMCFIRRAENYEDQNMVVSQHENSLYFTVIRDIFPKQELKVGYSYLYANRHNLSVLEKHNEDEQWPCFECTEQFPTSQDLQNHLNLHDDKKEKLKFRKRIWKSKRKLIKMATTEACQCRICQQVFNPPNYGILKKHLLTKHSINDKSVEDHFFIIRNYKCEKCHLVFNSESLFKIHNLQHNLHSNGDGSDDETFHICPSCNRKFPTQRQLISHVSIHSLPKFKMIPERFQCPVCYTSYPMRERLQKHMLVHGPEESKPLQCLQCKKRFMNNSALICHLKTHISSEEKIYECPICKDRFNHVPKLKMHVQKHCVNNTYTCPHCNKKFKAYYIIRKHIRAFHSGRKHTCQHCSKIFPTIFKLRMHLLRHSDHREFLCADCGKQFKRKDKFTEHCRRVHSEERENKMPEVISNEKPDSKKFDFHRFIYKCHPCLIGFKRRGMLVNHLAKRHPDISLDSVPELNLPILRATKDYYCQYCDKVYKSSSKRKAHILKNHPGAALPVSNRKQGAYPDVAGLPNPTFSQTVGTVTTSPQNCNWCHKQYASKAKLLQHQRKEHIELMEQPTEEEDDTLNFEKELKISRAMTEEIEDQKEIITCKANDCMGTERIPNENVIDEFVDDPEPDSQFCHLVNVHDNDVFGSVENLNLPNSHLYRLLTNTNNLVPPR